MKKSKSSATHFRAVSLLLLIGALSNDSSAAPGDVDLSFDPGTGVNGTVSAVALQADGKVILGGQFTTVRGLARINIARLHADGSGDSSFHAEAGSPGISSIVVQPDGKVLVARSVGFNPGSPSNRGIFRLNADGSTDTTFSASIETFSEGGGVYAMAVQPDGKVLIGGGFSAVNGTTRNGIARLNANGSVDRSFFAGAVVCCANSLTLQPDGKVLVLGPFNVNGTNRIMIVRLNADGGVDDTFDAGGEFQADKMALQPDGKILVAGSSTSAYQIARLDSDGSLDGSFNPGLPDPSPVASLVAQSDGKVLITGDFTSVNGTNRNGIARLNADGSLDSNFNPVAGPGLGSFAIAVAWLQPDGKILIGGPFGSVNGTPRKFIARLNADGSLDGTFNPGSQVNDRVTSLVVQPDGKALIGGTFTTVQGFARPGIARLETDGSLDSSFDPAIRFVATASHIRSVALQADGKVLITGNFDIGNGNDIQGRTITRLHADGSLDGEFQPYFTSFIPTDPCAPGSFACERYAGAGSVLVQPDGRVIINGNGVVESFGDDIHDYYLVPFLARFHADGSLDNSFNFGPGITEPVITRMVLQPDGKLLLVGGFKVNGTSRGVTRVSADGSLDPSFNPGIYIDGLYLHAIASQSDGKVLVGGPASSLSGAVARLNADGSLDGTFNPPTSGSDEVYSLLPLPNGKVLAGLFFATGGSVHTAVRLNPDGSIDTGFHRPVVSGSVMTSALQPDGNLLIGGDFTTVDGAVRPRVARLYGDPVILPPLSIERSGAFVILSWPSIAANFHLHETTDLSLPNSWTPVAQTAVTNAGQVSVTVPTAAPRKFFRLSLP